MAVTPIDWNAGGNTSLQEMLLADKLRAERQGRSRIASLIEPALGGDRAAMAGVFQGSPEMGTRIAQAVGTLELGKQRDLKAYTDFITHGGVGVLSLPPDQQPGAYAALFSEAQQRGYPVQGVPTEWGPQAKAFLTMQVNRAMPLARYFKTQGGGGAPAGGGGDIWGPAQGGAAPRVSAAPAPAGPVVADLPQQPPPPAQPMPAPTSVAQAGSPAMPSPAAQPPAATAPAPAAPTAPAPMQVAGNPALSEDMTYEKGADGDRLVVTEGGRQRLIPLPPGHRPAYFDKTGKPSREGGVMELIPVDAQGRRTGPAVMWRIPTEPQPRQPPAGFEPDPDNPNRLRPQPGGPQDPEFVRSQPKPPPSGYEPRPDQPEALRPIAGGPATDKLRAFDTSARDVYVAADRFMSEFEAQGGGNVSAYLNNPRDPRAQALLTAYNNMIMSLRGEGFANTGVLQPAEIAMLRNDFLSPQSIRGALASPEAMKAKIEGVKRYIEDRRANAYKVAGLPYEPIAPAAGPAPAPGSSVTVPMPQPGGPPTQGQPKRLRFNPATQELE
jgi:hypothetical protein